MGKTALEKFEGPVMKDLLTADVGKLSPLTGFLKINGEFLVDILRTESESIFSLNF